MAYHNPHHTVSIEHLYHYRCHECSQWFTIGDVYVEYVICPTCGTRGYAAVLDDENA